MTRPSVGQVIAVIDPYAAMLVKDSTPHRANPRLAEATRVAEAILALFEPETVTTADELDALPVGSVVLAVNGWAWQKEILGLGIVIWTSGVGGGTDAPSSMVPLPATVIHRGGQP